MDHFLALAEQVLHCVVYFWPLTLLLAAGWIGAFAVSQPKFTRPFGRAFLFACLPPLAFPVLILICGSIFAHEATPGARQAPAQFALYLNHALVLIQFPLAGLACWLLGRQLLIALASWFAAWYVSAFAWFVSGMSITGDWL